MLYCKNLATFTDLPCFTHRTRAAAYVARASQNLANMEYVCLSLIGARIMIIFSLSLPTQL